MEATVEAMRHCRLVLLLVCLLSGARSVHAATISDMLDRPVAVPEGPLRLVSLAPSLTEIVFALGRGDWLVGVTDFCNYPPAARSKLKVGGPVNPNLERIVELRPSLVLTTAEGNPLETVARLERIGIPVFAVRPETYPSIHASIRLLGHVLRREAAAATLIQEIQGRVAGVRRLVAERPRPRVLFLVWGDPLIAAGAATFVHDLIEMAGGDNVVRERTIPYPRLSWEEVVGSAPEVILVAGHREGPDPPSSAGVWNNWRSIPAVRSGRIVSMPPDTILRPGPRVGDGVERLARAIHPEAFPGGDIR